MDISVNMDNYTVAYGSLLIIWAVMMVFYLVAIRPGVKREEARRQAHA